MASLAGAQAPAADRFTARERGVLAAEAGIGDRVIARLEEVGFSSLAQVRAVGSAQAVAAVCDHLGSSAWRNRRKALERVLARAAAQEHDFQDSPAAASLG